MSTLDTDAIASFPFAATYTKTGNLLAGSITNPLAPGSVSNFTGAVPVVAAYDNDAFLLGVEHGKRSGVASYGSTLITDFYFKDFAPTIFTKDYILGYEMGYNRGFNYARGEAVSITLPVLTPLPLYLQIEYTDFALNSIPGAFYIQRYNFLVADTICDNVGSLVIYNSGGIVRKGFWTGTEGTGFEWYIDISPKTLISQLVTDVPAAPTYEVQTETETLWIYKTTKSISPINLNQAKIGDIVMQEAPDATIPLPVDIPPLVFRGDPNPPVRIEFTTPGTTFTLQDGSPFIPFADLKGANVFDLQLKKWGKLKADFKLLVSIAPVNETQNSVLPYTNLGLDAGVLDAAGNVILFDVAPTDSDLTYGKIGFYRLGYTNAEEVIAMFRVASTGTITVEASMDGRVTDPTLTSTTTFTAADMVTCYLNQSAKWFTVTISGQFDLQYLEFRGTIAGRR